MKEVKSHWWKETFYEQRLVKFIKDEVKEIK